MQDGVVDHLILLCSSTEEYFLEQLENTKKNALIPLEKSLYILKIICNT
jgi:hypothetical protein